MEAVTIGTATLYHGDCMEILPTLPKLDAVVSDPPYGIEADKAKAHSSIRDNSKWPESEWDKKRPPEKILRLLPFLAPTVCVWGGNYFADCFPPSPQWFIWRKPEAETGFSLADAEMCWTNGTGAVRVKTSPRRDGDGHPTQKTVAVMQWTMQQAKIAKGAVVADLFMGSGTTGVACINMGLRFIGIDAERRYFDIACERIERAQQQLKLAL